MDSYLKVQKTVKDNASDLQNYMLDLKNWEDGAKKKESDIVYGVEKDNIKREKQTVTRSDVDYVKAAFEDGCRQMKTKKWDLAEKSFSKAIKKYNKNPAFFIKRANCYIKLKKPALAEEDCTSALALDPKILKAKFLRSQAREMKDNLRGACLDLQDILILDPANLVAKAALSRLKPLYDESIRNEEPYLFHDEEDNTGKSCNDSILESLGGNEETSDDAALLEEKIQLANIEKEKGNNFVKKEKWEDAKEAYSRAIELNSSDPIFYANRALCYLKTKQANRAILDCCMALRKNPRYVKVYMRRAVAKKAIGDYWGARYDVKQVLKLEPNNSQAKSDLEELNILIEKHCIEKREVNVSVKTNKPYEVPVKKPAEFINVLPVNKPAHLRSKKPLQRIKIKCIDDTTAENVKKLPSKLCPSFNKFCDLNEDVNKNTSYFTEKKKVFLEKQLEIGEKQSPGTKPQHEIRSSNVLKKLESDSSQKEFQYVLPIEKKPHLRSKKPLLRIPIRFI